MRPLQRLWQNRRRPPLGVGDDELTAALREGPASPAMIERVMRAHNRRLYRVARSIVCNDALAEDVVQETYLKALTQLHQYRGHGPLSAWLTRIAMNEARAQVRRRGIERLAVQSRDASRALFGPTPEQVVTRAQWCRRLEAAIDRLPEGFRTVLVLRAVEGLSTQEAASSLGIAEETVKTRLHRARKLLLDDLGVDPQQSLAELFSFAGERCDRIVASVLRRLI